MGANSSKDHENETPSRSLSKPTIGKLPYCPLPLKFKESSDPNWAGEFSVFSKEMFQEFSVDLPAQDILSFSSTCQTLHSYLSEDIFWRHVIELRKTPILEVFHQRIFHSWKYWFFFQHKIVAKQIPSIPKPHYQYGYKVCVFGSWNLGKTALINSLNFHEFQEGSRDKITESYIRFGKLTCFLQFTETFTVNGFTTDPSALLVLLYSVGNRQTFEDATQKYYNFCKDAGCPKMLLVSNHNEIEESKREVSEQEAVEWAEQHDMSYVAVNLKDNNGIALLSNHPGNSSLDN